MGARQVYQTEHKELNQVVAVVLERRERAKSLHDVAPEGLVTWVGGYIQVRKCREVVGIGKAADMREQWRPIKKTKSKLTAQLAAVAVEISLFHN